MCCACSNLVELKHTERVGRGAGPGERVGCKGCGQVGHGQL